MSIQEKLAASRAIYEERRNQSEQRFYSLMRSVLLSAVGVFFAAYALLAYLLWR